VKWDSVRGKMNALSSYDDKGQLIGYTYANGTIVEQHAFIDQLLRCGDWEYDLLMGQHEDNTE
jgi:IS30 family transposase